MPVPRLARHALAALAGGAAATAVAVAFIPFRAPQRTVVAALLLVVVAVAAGVSGRRAAVGGAAVCAAAAFTFFDTQPYESFAIARSPDLATAVALVVVGSLTGGVMVRLVSTRQEGSQALRAVRGAAAMLAGGDELMAIIGAVTEHLVEVTGAAGCTFSAEPLAVGTPVISRSGVIDPPAAAGRDMALPVWALGEVVGHFLLLARPGGAPPHEALQVAGILADQAGAALAVHALPPPPGRPGGDRSPLLRVVPGGAAPGTRSPRPASGSR